MNNEALKSFVNDLAFIIRYNLKKYGILPQELINTTNSKNNKITAEILNFIASKCENNKQLSKLCVDAEELYNACLDIEEPIYKIIDLYINEFILKDKFVTIDNGKITNNSNSYTIKPSEESDLKKYYDKNKYRNLPLLILENGDCYFSPSSHNNLVKWLNATGIDCSNALRIDQFYRNGEVSISSMSMYRDRVTNVPKDFRITKKQAKTFYDIHCLIGQTKRIESITDSLINSFNLGIRENKPNGTKNLKTLIDEFGSDIDIYEIKRSTYNQEYFGY